MSYIQFENIKKSFGETMVLQGITLAVARGNMVTLLGPSGCGKSTLLRCLAGLEGVSGGRILLDGEDITQKSPKNRKIGMVFQQYSLFPNLNVFDNIAFGLSLQKRPAAEIRTLVEDAVDMVELNGKENSYPRHLSGGQQQRVALARSLVLRPKVLLLDEPLSAIDAKLRKSLQLRIKEIQKALNITCIFVTHDQDEALIMSDVIHLFNAGRVEQSGSPIELYTGPQTRFAAEFIGSYNLVEKERFAQMIQSPILDTAVAIRPETIDIVLEPPAEQEDRYVLPATVKYYIPHGNVLRYTVMVNGVELEADVLFRSFKVFEPEQNVYIVVEKRNCLPIAQ
ncbi:putative spermidine/putrescine transport system ATP-binding protein [Desulfitobacterium sp. LBE]|uniref:ABC transporter ATP-binding protein n=1 Tax=Desulfitobacterium sp. LBE TaxID=884086 RepID=UPI0011997166|nr:ABC transporter ATP-binding protein [Desulfitobacterium sp. LBE]TWH55965.1 putative spermidine/putrescine transport system ATP-binding protein [Desulfitobacterium sp. LBE]